MNYLNQVWKEYDDTEVTHSIIHYLFAIDELHKNKWYARAVDIANNLNITAWSCSISLKNLVKKWLINEDENKFYWLSEKWKNIVNNTIKKREVLFDFFYKKLWINKEIANINACKIEHLIWEEIINKIKEKF